MDQIAIHHHKLDRHVTYTEMVHFLFKTEGMHSHNNAIMHAAIGISGEVGELFEAIEDKNFPNLIEELGDMEFYLEALIAHGRLNRGRLSALTDRLYETSWGTRDVNDILIMLVKTSSSILDLCKKCWVYGKDFEKVKEDLQIVTEAHYAVLLGMYEQLAISRMNVLRQNMCKLIGPEGRYADAIYSDAAARERADKKDEQ